jgi:hypothetical protein
VLPDGSGLPEAFLDGGSFPSAAASATTGLVTWSGGDIRARRVASSGGPLGMVFVAGGAAGVQSESSVAWNGSTFTVAWQDARNATSIVDEQRDIFAGRVSEAGALLDGPEGFPVAASDEDERTPAVAGLGGDDLFTLALFVPGEPHAAMRIASVRRSAWKNVGNRHVRGHVLGGGPVPTVDAGGPDAPLLAGGGALARGARVELAVSNAAPGRPAFLVLGTRRADARFAGGVQVPALDARAAFVTGRDGSGVVSMRAPANLPPGVQLWAQCWVLDPHAPSGFMASNALTTTLP